MRNMLAVFVGCALLSLAIFSWAAGGQITFEQFRMLGRGMTEGQVLMKLGSPIVSSTISCQLSNRVVVCPVRWTYAMPDGWVADLVFISGQLSEFNNSRP